MIRKGNKVGASISVRAKIGKDCSTRSYYLRRELRVLEEYKRNEDFVAIFPECDARVRACR